MADVINNINNEEMGKTVPTYLIDGDSKGTQYIL